MQKIYSMEKFTAENLVGFLTQQIAKILDQKIDKERRLL